MKSFFSAAAAALLLGGCSKAIDAVERGVENAVSQNPAPGGALYTIATGAHYCDQNGYRPIETSEQSFAVRFDSSAVYTTANPENQYDINKLRGFTDNNSTDPLRFSARFGWRWSDGALRLFAFVHNNGSFTEKELGTVALNSEAQCRIQVKGAQYLFTLNGRTDSLPRLAATPSGKGYQLYPYFGGDEAAPHKVNIWIKEN
ncbi:MAG: hypothetical protein EOO16_22645 [Chitinophagaceae bacterium]|nr:MAG: hypothetical protein EOO16_22645 [Chitinophagaceae bacterium]